jgi:hypothetical protein
MNRMSKNSAVVTLMTLLVIAFAPEVSRAQDRQSPLMPPQSNSFGKSFQEWNALQTQYALATGLGTVAVSDTVRNVRLLPGDFTTATPVFNIDLAPGTPFVAAPFFVFGERYDDPNVPDDDPVAIAAFLEEVFADAHITIELDGRVLLDGSGTELRPYLWGPVYLNNPVVYNTPIPRDVDLNAVAALWTMGFGAVYSPLSVGQHTLVYKVQSAFFGDSQFTYNIRVSPK